MICNYCYYYSDSRECCDFNFDIVSDYLPPCCVEDESQFQFEFPDYVDTDPNKIF